MKLTTQQRKDMPDNEYALPSERRFPINDSGHARKALQLLPRAKDVSEDEKKEIIRKAHAKLMKK